jgi:hypothetical protein
MRERRFTVLGCLIALVLSARSGVMRGQGLPTMTFDTTPLIFGATFDPWDYGQVVAQTARQLVYLTQSGSGAVSWTAAPSTPWLRITPSAGTGGAELSISIDGDPLALWPDGRVGESGTVRGVITLTFVGAANSTRSIDVTLNLIPDGASASPFGWVDTPINNAAGVIGAIPMTGWALDDVEVASVTICRVAAVGEPVSRDDRCGGAEQIFVGDGVFIDGTRLDVQTSFPTYPRNRAGGWGFMLLTSTLPNQGNGSYTFSVYARDREGHVVLLGKRTITCDNANATMPFGTIDTPAQGETISGPS